MIILISILEAPIKIWIKLGLNFDHTRFNSVMTHVLVMSSGDALY